MFDPQKNSHITHGSSRVFSLDRRSYESHRYEIYIDKHKKDRTYRPKKEGRSSPNNSYNRKQL